MNKRKPTQYDPYNDFYFVLGVMPSATAEELQHAYRQRAKQVHPDLNRDRVDWANDQFQKLNEAYDVLGDPTMRIEYDRMRRNGGQRSAPVAGNWWDQPHAPGQPPPRSTPPQARSTGTHQARPTNPGPDRPPGTPVGAYQRSTGAYRAAPGYTTPRYHPGKPVYRNDFEAVVHGLTKGSNRYIITAVVALMASYVMCAAILTAMKVFPPDSTNAADSSAYSGNNRILVTLDATDPIQPTVVPQCTDKVQITDPQADASLIGNLTIRGTATDPNFYSYDVSVDWLGSEPNSTEVLKWWILKNPVYTSVTDGVLVSVANFTNLSPGYYILRLTVTLQGGGKLPPCEVRVSRRQF